MRTLLLLFLIVRASLGKQVDYVEYRPGNVNVILTVPHGGFLSPDEIPDRIAGCVVADGQCEFNHDESCADSVACFATTDTDTNTIQMADIVAAKLEELLGRKPHVIVNNLDRKKLDPNREEGEAAQGNPAAVEAFQAFHGFVEASKSTIAGRAILLDLHGQAHYKNSSELGYLLTGAQLDQGDYDATKSSIRTLSEVTGLDGRTLMTGPDQSFGALLEAEGFRALPSPRQPSPGGDPYFIGGYIVEAHGSLNGGLVDAMLVEAPREVRVDGGEDMLRAFGEALARAIVNFRTLYYTSPSSIPCSSS